MLRTEQLSYRYLDEKHGLDPISLAIQAGEMVLVSGPSGCGKSTLARCLSGLIPHLYKGQLQGKVWIDNLFSADTPLWQLTEHVGLLFQNPAAQMLASTVEDEIVFGLENLGLPRQTIGDRLEKTLLQFGLSALVDRSPLTLSGGEQQKVALAATMARQPPALVLDEPLSMLDAAAAEELVDHLNELAQAGTAVIVCEHRSEPFAGQPGLRTIELGDGAWPVPDMDTTTFPVEVSEPFALDVSGLGVKLGERQVLRDLDFSLAGGQVVAIVGRNGVGKTTLLRALAGLQRHSGMATVDGEHPDLALVFQNPDWQLFNATVRDEILFKVPNPDLGRYRWLRDVLGLCDHETAQPLLLSEGQKKRVALATALMRVPRHGVLLDEPSLGQDTDHKARLMRLARALADAGRLVIMTTHDLWLAARADRLLLLGPDGVAADGSPAAIWHDEPAWARIGLHLPWWARQAAAAGEAAIAGEAA